jgi:hypothetical protein
MSMSHIPPPYGHTHAPGAGPGPGYGQPGYPSPPGPVPPPPAAGRWSRTIVAGLVAAALGFVEISFSSSRTVNGVVVECDYVNLAPWLFGPVALVCGVLGLARAGRQGPASGRDRALGLVCVAVGALHLLQAFGLLDPLSSNPC